MPGVPKREGGMPAPEGSRYPSETFGDNLAAIRRRRGLSQNDIAHRMVMLGHLTWRRDTVGQVERAARSVSLDELVALALATGRTMADLLDPGEHGWRVGVARSSDPDADYLEPPYARVIARSELAVEVDGEETRVPMHALASLEDATREETP